MVKHAIGSMILTAAILATPALAATSNETVGSAPATADHAAPPPANNMAAGLPHNSTRPATPAATSANQPTTPRFTTADDQLRLGKIVGATVYNGHNQSVGSIDDVLMGKDQKATTAVISVGGFLGVGGKLVSVPFDQLKITQDKIVMPGATKQSLSSMPAFKYNNA
ncbi:MAG TPA: PRC-barrel domain-containing protein [Acetobacteraceae bacterium]|jgi:hypothetical protein|nr:PRC-barrel domain-containing protein [Acetobacteraceae bacterium]